MSRDQHVRSMAWQAGLLQCALFCFAPLTLSGAESAGRAWALVADAGAPSNVLATLLEAELLAACEDSSYEFSQIALSPLGGEIDSQQAIYPERAEP